MSTVQIKKFLEAGVHFGHQTRKWNPKMSPFIFGEKNKIHIIDLQKTLACVKRATQYIEETVAAGKNLLFVGTKKQAQISLEEAAQRSSSPHVTQRWLGGMLTNFSTVRLSISKMNNIKNMEEANDYGPLTKKERNSLIKERGKLEKNLGGINTMEKLPGAVFVVDTKKEHIAVKEAQKLHIPIIALIDTNSDPDGIDFPVPGNDDAIRSIHLIANIMADAVMAGRKKCSPAPKSSSKQVESKEEVKVEVKETEEVTKDDSALESVATEKDKS
ncbi:30S ribosomal protein S2 [Candidatus Omnitrophota bacterium]